MKKYEPISYWSQMGKTRIKQRRWFDKQQEIILKTLQNHQINSILEIGCGDGRITELIIKNFDIKKYHAIDISSDRINRTKKLTSKYADKLQLKLIQSSFQDFQSREKYDLVIAVEVLMHVPPEEVGSFVKKMKSLSKKYIFNLDYYPKKGHEWKRIFRRISFIIIHQFMRN